MPHYTHRGRAVTAALGEIVAWVLPASRVGITRTPAAPRATLVAVAAVVLLIAPPALADGPAIIIDGRFDDWSSVVPDWTDAAGDGGTSGIDFGEVKLRSTASRFFISFETGREISLQGERGLVLAIELDNDATTGRALNGLGIDFEWHFGAREGIAFGPEGKERLRQADVGLRQAPTVSSDRFEVSFERGVRAAGIVLFEPGTIRVVIEDRSGGDVAPDASSVLEYALWETTPDEPPLAGLERHDPTHVRVLSYNVLFDGLFERPEFFERIVGALEPDVICFQEIYRHDADAVAAAVATILGGDTWRAAGRKDCFVASRYPIERSRVLGPADENVWAFIDLPDDLYDADLSIVSAHPPCCARTSARQEEFDVIMAWLRELQGFVAGGNASGATPGDAEDAATVPQGTLTVIAGDMNLVTDSSQLLTLTDGTIGNAQRFGPSFAPDWDGTALADAFPLHLTGLESYTWRNDEDTYAPGRLDFIIYSDSVAEQGNSFALWTPDLPYNEFLEPHGLKPHDTLRASDHLPIVVDLSLPPGGAGARFPGTRGAGEAE